VRLSHTPLILTFFAIGCAVGVFGFTAETPTKTRHWVSVTGKNGGFSSALTREAPSETALMIGDRPDADVEEFARILRLVSLEERQRSLPIGRRDDGIMLNARLLDLSWERLIELLGDGGVLFHSLRLAREENPLVFESWLKTAVAEGRADLLTKGWRDDLNPMGKQLLLEFLLPLSSDHPEMLDSRGVAACLELADTQQLTNALRGVETLNPSQNISRLVETAAIRLCTLDTARAAQILASTSNPDIREALMKRLPAQITDNLISSLPPDSREGVFAAQAAQVLSGDAPVAEVAASLGRMSTTGELDSQVKEVVSGFLERSSDAARAYDAAVLVEDETLRNTFIQQTTATLAQIDPHEASLQLDRVMQSGHTVPDTAIVALVGQIRNDPEACRIWASHIADPKLKQEMLSKYNIPSGGSSK
jgi:hypothetical protein